MFMAFSYNSTEAGILFSFVQMRKTETQSQVSCRAEIHTQMSSSESSIPPPRGAKGLLMWDSCWQLVNTGLERLSKHLERWGS